MRTAALIAITAVININVTITVVFININIDRHIIIIICTIVVIGIAVINALSNTKTSYAELVFTSGGTACTAFVLEQSRLLRPELMHSVIFDDITLIHADRHADLMENVRQRTGLPIHRLEIGRIDYLRDTATVRVFYYRDEGDVTSAGWRPRSRADDD